MAESLMYELTGYDKDELVSAWVLPRHCVVAAKEIAGVLPTDDGLGSFPLGPRQVAEIAKILGITIPVHTGVDYFLEPYMEENRDD